MLTTTRIRQLFHSLNAELAGKNLRGDIYLAGGAVMCLVFQSRAATRDVDAMLVPSTELRAAAQAVAASEGVPADWLNDAVKGFLSERGTYDIFESLSNLRIYVPHPGYLLAMKCLAMRLGEEYHDLDDVSVLVQELGLKTIEQAEAVLAKYYDLARFPAKARYVLEDLIDKSNRA